MVRVKTWRFGWPLVLAVGLVLTLGLAAACDDDDDSDGGATPGVTEDAADDAADVEAAFRAAVDTWNGGDLVGFLDAFTDEGVLALFAGFSREVVLQEFGADAAGDPIIEIQDISVEASATEGTVDVVTVEGAFQHRQRITFIKQGDEWLVNDFEPLTQDVPDDKVNVDLEVAEYYFEFEESDITGGNLAFNVSNVGGEAHEMLLERVPENLDIEAALQSEEEPEGIEPVGFLGPWAPGATATPLLVDDLGAGRYVLLCFVPNAEGTPHALLGMWAEFTIADGGTATE